MGAGEYIKCYIEKLNTELDVCLNPEIKESKYYRYALFSNCVDNTIYIWEELFESLTEDQKQLHIIYAYSVLLAAKYFGKEKTIDGEKSYELPFNPNKISRILCKLVNLRFRTFEELQKEIYDTKQRLFPFPDSKGTCYKVGDVIRNGLSKYIVTSIYSENDSIIISAQSINIDKGKTISYPEKEMLDHYRIVEPVEFYQNS